MSRNSRVSNYNSLITIQRWWKLIWYKKWIWLNSPLSTFFLCWLWRRKHIWSLNKNMWLSLGLFKSFVLKRIFFLEWGCSFREILKNQRLTHIHIPTSFRERLNKDKNFIDIFRFGLSPNSFKNALQFAIKYSTNIPFINFQSIESYCRYNNYS